jgi:hypothetical protein
MLCTGLQGQDLVIFMKLGPCVGQILLVSILNYTGFCEHMSKFLQWLRSAPQHTVSAKCLRKGINDDQEGC